MRCKHIGLNIKPFPQHPLEASVGNIEALGIQSKDAPNLKKSPPSQKPNARDEPKTKPLLHQEL
eukprot:4855766-Amphidinium_carterae.1